MIGINTASNRGHYPGNKGHRGQGDKPSDSHAQVKPELKMKARNKLLNKHEAHSDLSVESAEVADFHRKRMRREEKIEDKKESSTRPEGNYEYEQLIAEEACFNAKPMIEKAAYRIAEGRAFAPGHELSDWLQAEAQVEGLLRGGQGGASGDS